MTWKLQSVEPEYNKWRTEFVGVKKSFQIESKVKKPEPRSVPIVGLIHLLEELLDLSQA